MNQKERIQRGLPSLLKTGDFTDFSNWIVDKPIWLPDIEYR
jgi:hypothetical protein